MITRRNFMGVIPVSALAIMASGGACLASAQEATSQSAGGGAQPAGNLITSHRLSRTRGTMGLVSANGLATGWVEYGFFVSVHGCGGAPRLDCGRRLGSVQDHRGFSARLWMKTLIEANVEAILSGHTHRHRLDAPTRMSCSTNSSAAGRNRKRDANDY